MNKDTRLVEMVDDLLNQLQGLVNQSTAGESDAMRRLIRTVTSLAIYRLATKINESNDERARKHVNIPVLRVPVDFSTRRPQKPQKVGRLSIIGIGSLGKFSAYRCLCDCGKEVTVRASDVDRGKIKSCGCLRREMGRAKSLKHGLCGTPEYERSKHARRRAAKAQRTPKWANHDAILAIYQNCPPGHHVDHIVPLQGTNVSGLHVENNLQYLPAKENIRKGNSWSAKAAAA